MPKETRYPIINDSTPTGDLMAWQGRGRGLRLDLRTAEGYGSAAEPFPREMLIPRSEWQARIEEREERKARLVDLCDYAGLPVKDQAQTNYCWINAPAHCVEIIRLRQGQPKVILSPASAGAQIKNFRNVGGWGLEGLQFIEEHGLAPVDRWPANAIDRRYLTPETRQAMLDYRVIEWWELTPRSLDETISCLLHGIPIAAGYNWWGHEITIMDAAWLDGQAVGLIDNSWGPQWGTNGRGILQGQRLLPDDAVAPRVAIAA